jgi:hypothetical protein
MGNWNYDLKLLQLISPDTVEAEILHDKVSATIVIIGIIITDFYWLWFDANYDL